MRILATLLRPDSGDAVIASTDLRRSPGQVRKQIGFVAQGSGTNDQSAGLAVLTVLLSSRLFGREIA